MQDNSMQQLIKATAAACLAFSATVTMAAPVLLGSVEHLYGTADGRVSPTIFSEFHPGGNCDTANTTSITVAAKTASSCNRFGDIFDFSAIDFASIDHFDVVLTFSGARDQVASLERWTVRASPNYVLSGIDFGTLNASGTQTFTLNSTNANFSKIVDAEDLMLGFSANLGTSLTFNLSSARVNIFGTAAANAVPEPASLALVGVSLAALAAARRKKKPTA